MPKAITPEEFKEYIDKNFYQWMGQSDRPLSSFLLSLEEWAVRNYNRSSKEEEKDSK